MTIASLTCFDNFSHWQRLPVVLSFSKMIPPTWKSLLTLFHLPLLCRVTKNSFRQRHQNLLAMCWTLLLLLRLFKSGRENIGGGKATLVFMVSKLLGQSGASLPISLMVSTVKGLDLMMYSTSTKNVTRDSSFKLVPCCFINANNMARADLI